MAGADEVFPDLFNKMEKLDNRFQNLKNKIEKAKKEGKQGLSLEKKAKPVSAKSQDKVKSKASSEKSPYENIKKKIKEQDEAKKNG